MATPFDKELTVHLRQSDLDALELLREQLNKENMVGTILELIRIVKNDDTVYQAYHDLLGRHEDLVSNVKIYLNSYDRLDKIKTLLNV